MTHNDDLNGWAVESSIPAGLAWFEVTNPLAEQVAARPGPARSMKTPAKKREQRRELRKEQRESAYLQIRLSENRGFQKQMKAILNKGS